MQYPDSGTLLDMSRRNREALKKIFVAGKSRHSTVPRDSRSNYFDLSHEEIAAQQEVNGIAYRPASSRADLLAAFALLQQRYEDAGLTEATPHHPGSSFIRMMPYHGWQQSQVFVAAMDERIVGTVTLILDGEFELPMAECFPREICAARRIGKVCEIASLAVDPIHPRPTEIFGQLTRLLAFFARHHGMDSYIATVHPRHAKFYQHAMGFEVIGDEIECQQVLGNPGVAVLGSVNDKTKYRARWENHYFSGSFPIQQMQPRPISTDEFRDCQSVIDQQRIHAELQRGNTVTKSRTGMTPRLNSVV